MRRSVIIVRVQEQNVLVPSLLVVKGVIFVSTPFLFVFVFVLHVFFIAFLFLFSFLALRFCRFTFFCFPLFIFLCSPLRAFLVFLLTLFRFLLIKKQIFTECPNGNFQSLSVLAGYSVESRNAQRVGTVLKPRTISVPRQYSVIKLLSVCFTRNLNLTFFERSVQ